MKQLVKDPAGWKKIMTSQDKDSILFRRNLRSAMVVTPFLIAGLAGSDDDDDEEMSNMLFKAVGDMTVVFNIKTMEYNLKSPMALLPTTLSFLGIIDDAIKMKQYKSTGEGYSEGDYRVLNDFKQVIPYGKIGEIDEYFE